MILLRGMRNRNTHNMTQTKGTKEWAVKNINFSKGCSNNCQYCYARRMANRFGWRKWENWSKMTNCAEMEEKRFKKTSGRIMSPSSHDITIHNLDLAKKVFYHILEAHNSLLIVSKPKYEIILELADHLADFKSQILWRFTIGTLDDNIREKWEPGAPTINSRLRSLEEMYKQYWHTSVSIEPFLGNDVIELINRLESFVTDTIWVGPMNKIHVPKERWSQRESTLYSPQALFYLKQEIDAMNNPKIRYKDHFLKGVNRFCKSTCELEILS